MTSGMRMEHLTDAEFSDMLAGELPDATTRAHLAGCEYCRGELEVVRGSLADLHAMGTAWARVAAPSRVPVPSRWVLGLGSRPSWGAGLAATAVTGVLAFALSWPGGGVLPSGSAAATDAAAKTDFAEDNQLMVSINQELSDQVQPAVSTSELRTEVRQDERHTAEAVLD